MSITTIALLVLLAALVLALLFAVGVAVGLRAAHMAELHDLDEL